MTGTIDEARLDSFLHQMVGHMTGAALCFGVLLGEELGLYRALAGAGPLTADALADKAGCNRRLTREWLDGQAAAGLVGSDPAAGSYELSAEAAAVLADDTSPAFVARGMTAIASVFVDHDKIGAAFRGDGGLRWGEHDPLLFSGTEWFFRTGYRTFLPEWLLAMDGVDAKLRSGGTVADVGCGHGASAVVMAQTYPAATVRGFDYHLPSVQTARARAAEAGVADRATFEVAAAKDYPGRYDLICFFDCLHDMGDPEGTARYAREHLEPDGSVLLVEPFAIDDKNANLTENPLAAMFYTVSSAICTPNSLSQEVASGLGAQAGEERLRRVFQQAGYSRFGRVAETPMNLILEARP